MPTAFPHVRARFKRAAILFASASFIAAPPALAQSDPDALLRERLEAQAAHIASLEARLAALEAGNGSAAQTAPVPAGNAPVVDDGRVDWSAGVPQFASADGTFTLRPLGQLILDASTTVGSAAADRTKTGARALHIGFAGSVGDSFLYQLETELAGGDANMLWAYLGWRGRVGTLETDVLLGNLQNDRGVDGSSGGEALPFIEPNFVATTIAPERGDFGLGVQGRLFGPDWHISAAVTGDDIDARRDSSDNRVAQLRAHWNPIKRPGAALHLGVWGFDEAFSGSDRDFRRSLGVAHGLNGAAGISSPPVAGATGDRGYGAELGGYAGRFWMMGEAARRVLHAGGATVRSEEAASLGVGLFLTETSAPYNPRTGNFGRPEVGDPVFAGGSGAFELTARGQWTDLGEAPGAGDARATTIGLNWYLNDFVRLMLNGTHWSRDPDGAAGEPRDSGQTAAVRAQLAF